jgi:membrane fusion protein (multidrug efflux system)
MSFVMKELFDAFLGLADDERHMLSAAVRAHPGSQSRTGKKRGSSRFRWSWLAALAIGLSGCKGMRGPGANEEKVEGESEKAAAVYVQKIGRRTLIGRVSAASTIEAELKADVHAESSGRLVSLKGEEGQGVEKGDVLAHIRRDAQSSSMDRANTSVAQARRDYERLVELAQQGVVGQAELDTANDRLRSAELDLRDRKRDLANTSALAPFSGILTERHVTPGTYVAMGAKLFTLVDFSSLVARVYFPEKELDHVAVGQSVEIASKTVKGRRGEGKVLRIAPAIDPQSGTFRVTVALPKELAGTSKGFLPGMYAEVVLTTQRLENAIAAPKSALLYEGAQVFAFVEENGIGKRRRVTTGLVDGEWVEISEGLREGEMLIVAGQQGLRDGAAVEVKVPGAAEISEQALANPGNVDEGEKP